MSQSQHLRLIAGLVEAPHTKARSLRINLLNALNKPTTIS